MDGRALLGGLEPDCWRLDILAAAGVQQRNRLQVMVKAKIGGHTVEYYDAIDALPIVRYHRYQKALLIDAGVGADIVSFDQRTERIRRFLMKGDNENARKEMENLRQCVYLIQTGLSPKHLAFAALVHKIDGKIYEDLSDDGLMEVVKILSDGTQEEVQKAVETAKKKIDTDLTLFFPKLFAESEVKEYFDILKKRTLAILKNMMEGVVKPDETEVVEKITTELITYSNPKVFGGSEGLEVTYDRQFENLCLALSSHLNLRPKKCTVLEFYNAFDYLQEQARRNNRENASSKGRR